MQFEIGRLNPFFITQTLCVVKGIGIASQVSDMTSYKPMIKPKQTKVVYAFSTSVTPTVSSGWTLLVLFDIRDPLWLNLLRKFLN